MSSKPNLDVISIVDADSDLGELLDPKERERARRQALTRVRRLSPGEFGFPAGAGAGTGTSGVSGIQTVALKGDPDRAGLYTIMLRIPPHTRIAPHLHQDDRVATVISGTWYIGYGEKFNGPDLKPLPVGSFYTEPSNRAHFAETRDEPVIVQITGVGPSSTQYIDPSSDPRRETAK